jgi:hypothetical protein
MAILDVEVSGVGCLGTADAMSVGRVRLWSIGAAKLRSSERRCRRVSSLLLLLFSKMAGARPK